MEYSVVALTGEHLEAAEQLLARVFCASEPTTVSDPSRRNNN